ncbi:MAG: hypothetical protein MJZ11_07815 [Lachnospiraceae bacterium]|nr:hypothetical protein [Lachnospiraceae bacterium]
MIIEILFPEVCNLYGDLANIKYLKECVPTATIIETSLKTTPHFVDSKVDLIYMGTTTEAGIKLSVEALSPYKDKLKALIDDGQFILLTGNALDVFGNYIDIKDDDTKIDCLGIINTHSEYHMMKRHNSFYIGEFKDMEIVGFKSIFGHTYEDGNDQEGWFKTTKGFGQNPDKNMEGFKLNNLYATYLIGPLLPLNPPLTKWLLEELGEAKDIAFEEAAVNAYKQRLIEFKNEHFDAAY